MYLNENGHDCSKICLRRRVFYCRYEEGHNPRHLEWGSERIVGGGRWGGEEEKRGPKGREAREHMVQLAGLYRKEKLGEGKQSLRVVGVLRRAENCLVY